MRILPPAAKADIASGEGGYYFTGGEGGYYPRRTAGTSCRRSAGTSCRRPADTSSSTAPGLWTQLCTRVVDPAHSGCGPSTALGLWADMTSGGEGGFFLLSTGGYFCDRPADGSPLGRSPDLALQHERDAGGYGLCPRSTGGSSTSALGADITCSSQRLLLARLSGHY